MQRKLQLEKAIDVSRFVQNEAGEYLLTFFKEDVDYCNAKTKNWIWFIGQENKTGLIYAAHDNRFYQHPAYMPLAPVTMMLQRIALTAMT